MTGIVEEVERRLREQLDPDHLEIVDDSQRHAGHAGAVAGGAHLTVTIVSRRFEDHTRLEQHRMVYEALGGLMGTRVHALGLKTVPTSRWKGGA